MVFGLGELVAEGGGFAAILLGLLAVLNRADCADRVEDFAHGIVFLAGVFELVGEIVLLRGVGIEFVDAADEILDALLALGLDDGGIGGGCVGGFPGVVTLELQDAGDGAEIVDAVLVALIGGETIPREGFGEIGLHALPELKHPTELIFRVAISLPRGFVKPREGLAVVGLDTGAVLEDVADVFLGVGVAVFGGFVIPGEGFDVILRLAPAFPGHVAELVFGVGVAVGGGAAIPGDGLGVVWFADEAALVVVAECLFGVGIILIGGFAIEVEGLMVIATDSAGVLVHGG